jgi:predicted amino acid-binding ACT domain protein
VKYPLCYSEKECIPVVVSENCDPVIGLAGEYNQETQKVHLSWIAPENTKLTGFKIYKNNVNIADVSNTVTEYFDNITSLGNYNYCIVAKYSLCNSEAECIPVVVSEGCDPVINLAGEYEQETQKNHLSWIAPSNTKLTGFKIYRNNVNIIDVSNTVTEYFDNITVSGNYNYCIVAKYPLCNSDQECISINVPVFECDPVANLEGVYDAQEVGVRLAWDAPTSSGLTGFKIYRNEDKIADLSSTVTKYIDYISPIGGDEITYCVVAVYLSCDPQEDCVYVHIGINKHSTISLYPNPAKEEVRIEGEGVANIEVYNSTGQLVGRYENVGVVDVSSYKAGIYFFNVTTVNGNIEKFKIVVNK